MQVTVEDGYITDITILSFRDDQEVFHKAQSAVINAILTEQTPDVSTVSGATFSSSSIMDAVADALGSSFKSSEQSVDESNDASGQPADRNPIRYQAGFLSQTVPMWDRETVSVEPLMFPSQ